MKVIVMGGAGFIGRHVVDKLLLDGDQVTVFDRFQKSFEVFKEHEQKSRIKFFLGDICDREKVITAIREHDAVINLAGLLGTMECVHDPHPSIDVNIHGALNVFEACKKCTQLPNGIRAAQIAVGNHFMQNTYAISKTTAERFALMFNKEFGTQIAIVRGLNAYGERQKPKPIRKITPNFIIRALRGEPIKIFGKGESVMDMIYVKDLANVLVCAIKTNHGIYDRVFEAGTGRATTVNEIAECINTICNNHAGVEHIPMRQGEPEQSVVLGDPSTLKPLGIEKEFLVTMEDGMAKTIKWYSDNWDLDDI